MEAEDYKETECVKYYFDYGKVLHLFMLRGVTLAAGRCVAFVYLGEDVLFFHLACLPGLIKS